MINIIYGPAGCGKSTKIYNSIVNDLRDGKKPILIVPDQYILNAESAIADLAEDVSTFDLEILSFRRLANHVFRELGGLSFNDIDESGKLLVMWRVLREVSPFLKMYGNIDKGISSFAELMLETVTELKQFSLSPADIEKASQKLSSTHEDLSKKLYDISFIYGSYQSFLANEYNDPTDELTRLAETLDGSGFFNDNNIYFDAFDGFTPQQINVIRLMVDQAQSVTFSLCFDPTDETGIFLTTEKTYKKILDLVNNDKEKINECFLPESLSFKYDDLAYVSKNFWKHELSSEEYNGDKTHVNTICCHDEYEECEAVVSSILKKIKEAKNGEIRYKDFVIIARDINAYEGIIDSELENNGIPFHLSKRTDISSKPIFKLILAAFAIHNRNWKYSDVISFLKTGLAGVSYDDIDTLENYVSYWNINGRRWTDGMDWHMNPDGYVETLSKDGQAVITTANSIKNKIVPSLTKLFESIGGSTVKDVTVALYDFLNDLKVKKQIENKAAKYRERGDINEEKELVQLWNILINSLDMLVDLAGDVKLNGEDYVSLISMILGKADIGTIPASIDRVMLGSASSLRTTSVPHVYLLGVNEGVFPMSVNENKIFSDREKEIIKTVVDNFADGSDEQSNDELYWFYKSISKAQESLTLTYCDSDLSGAAKKISVAGARIGLLIGKDVQKYSSIPLEEKMYGYSVAMKAISQNNDNEFGVALKEYFSKKEETALAIETFSHSLVDNNSDIDKSISTQIYKGDIVTSQSKINEYVNCSYSYHCKYILNLKEKRPSGFLSVDIGNFVHAILEKFIAKITDKDNELDFDIEDDVMVSIVDDIISDYISDVFQGESNNSPRLIQLIKRLRRTSLLLIRNILAEFKQSEFVPHFFELPVYEDRDDGIEPYEVQLEDGTKLYMHGYVDRVDTYKKGKDVYVRIIDYKTGTKEFCFDDVEKGLNLQLLLYLFAVWNSKKPWFLKELNCDGKILPAGILYYMAKAPHFELKTDDDVDKAYETALRSIDKNGLLISDIEILKAMDKDLKGIYIPFKYSKDKGMSNPDYLMSIEQMGDLARKVEEILNQIASQMKNGKVKAKPITDKERETPCRYCRMKPICRRVRKGEDD